MAERGYQQCVAAIKAVAPDLTTDDITEVLETIERKSRARGGAGDPGRLVAAAKEMAAEEALKLAIEKRARQAALLARTRRQSLYEAATDKIQAISDRISTTQRAGAGRALSTEAIQAEARQAYLGAIAAGWRAAGVDTWLKRISPEDEASLAREIARQNGGKGIPTTDRAEIRQAAEAVVGVQRLMREEHNAAGAWVGELEGRITRTSHDARRMAPARFGPGAEAARQADFARWRDFALPRLSERTWEDAGIDPGDAAAVQKFMRDVYANLVSGNHQVAAKGELDPLSGFKAPGSLARRLSEDRVLHWKGPDEWLAYNREYGTAGLVAAIVSEADHGAKATGLLRVWGPNPEAALQQDVERLAKSLKDDIGDLAQTERLGKAMQRGGKLDREWAVITGEADRPVNRTWAHNMAAWRALETITSLGGMVISALPDLATQASALRHEGMSYWRVFGHQVAALLPEGKDSLRREVSARVAVGLNGLMGGLYHRMGYDISAPERITRGVDWFFKLNLQNWWQDAQERGISALLTNHLAENLRRGWAGLEPQFRTSLERFGMTAEDWAAMQGVRPLEGGGTRYWTPDLLPAEARQTRERIGAWLAQTMGDALTRPGAYEKALMTMGQPPGTALGEALRMMGQFKSYPLTFLTKHWARELHREGEADFGGLAGMIAATTLLGAAAMTLKDLASGRNPREVEDAGDAVKFVTRAMTQGGGAGIYGDYLFGEFNRFGGGLLATAGGPGAGTLEKMARMFSTARSRLEGSDDGNLPAQAIGFVARDVLPTNLFYAKAALDHLVIHGLQEAVNPGYLRRLERRVERDNNQTFWLRPTDAVRY